MLTEEAKQAQREYQRQWKSKNREKCNSYHREWRSKNKDKLKEYRKRYWEKVAADAEKSS